MKHALTYVTTTYGTKLWSVTSFMDDDAVVPWRALARTREEG